MTKPDVRPPRFARLLLRAITPTAIRDAVDAEVRAAFRIDLRRHGRSAARRRYWREVFAPGLLRLRWELGRDRTPSASPHQPTLPGRGRRPRVSDMIQAFLHDLRSAVRALRARPAFTALAVVTLAIGIGATTTIYAFVDCVLLRALPYPDAGRLVYFAEGSHPNPRFLDWQENADSFDSLAAAWVRPRDLIGEGDPARLRVGVVTADFFELFGAQPMVGRLFGDSDFGESPTVVLAYGAWRDRWGGNESVVGSTIRLGGEPVVVIGVVDPRFVPPEALVGEGVDAWVPYRKGDLGYDSWAGRILSVAGRLRPGVSIEAARAELDALSTTLAARDPDHYVEDGRRVLFPIEPMLRATIGDASRILWMLFGAAGLMLLLCCANVANLTLARGTDRAREIALRSAVGASRARLVSQLLTESVLLALTSGLLGIGVATLGVDLLGALTAEIPRASAVRVDLWVLAASIAASAVTGALVGVLPAIQARRTEVADELKEGGRASTAGGERVRVRASLVVVEVALALVLTIGAGLILSSFGRLTRIDPGFEPDGALTVRIDLQRVEPADRAAFLERIRERVAAIPGVEGVGAGATVPFQLIGGARCCWFDSVFAERDGGLTEEPLPTFITPVDAGYFTVLRIPLHDGRLIDERDDAHSPGAVVTVSGARRLFGEDDVVGRRISIGDAFEMPIVGVIEDVMHWGPGQPTDEDLFVPFDAYHDWLRGMTMVVRTARTNPTLASNLRRAVWSVAPELPVDGITDYGQLVSRSFARTRFATLLLGGFAVLGLVVAAAGIYASLLYWVGRRSHEIGVRMALGARPGEVVGMVVRQAAAQLGAGLLIGLLAAAAVARLLEGLLFEVAPTDARTYALAACLLAVVGFLACWLPARAASHSDPIATLRSG